MLLDYLSLLDVMLLLKILWIIQKNLIKELILLLNFGLQTIHEKTSKLINRGHTLEEFDSMVKKLRNRNIDVVVILLMVYLMKLKI